MKNFNLSRWLKWVIPFVGMHFGCADEVIPFEGNADLAIVRNSKPIVPNSPKKIRLLFHVLRGERFTQPAHPAPVLANEVAAKLTTLVNGINDIYRDSGIEFVVQPHEMLDTTAAGFPVAADEVDSSDEKHRLMEHAIKSDKAYQNLNVVVARIRNLGFDGHAHLPWSRNSLRQGSGILISDQFVFPYPSGNQQGTVDPQILAHEIGHALGLWHLERGVNDGETDDLNQALKLVHRQAAGLSSGPGADAQGDFCMDTPPIPFAGESDLIYTITRTDSPDVNVPPVFEVEYKEPVNPPFRWPAPQVGNLMRTSGDRSFLTLQQSQRMHGWIDSRLRSWLLNDVGTPVHRVLSHLVFDSSQKFKPGVRLEWYGPSTASFQIERSRSPDFNQPDDTHVSGPFSSATISPTHPAGYRSYHFEDYTVEKNLEYWYRIGVNGSGYGHSTRMSVQAAGSRTGEARPSLTPGKPEAVSVPGGVLVKWRDPDEADITGYLIRRWKNGVLLGPDVGPVAAGTSLLSSYIDERFASDDGSRFDYQVLSFLLKGSNSILSGNLDDGLEQGRDMNFTSTPAPVPPVASYLKTPKVPATAGFSGTISLYFNGKVPALTQAGRQFVAKVRIYKDAEPFTEYPCLPFSSGQLSPKIAEVPNLTTGANYGYTFHLQEEIDLGTGSFSSRPHGISQRNTMRIPGKITTSPLHGIPASGETGVWPYPVFTWTPVQDAASYDIIILGPNYDNVTIRVPANLISYALTAAYPELDALATYTWRLRALNDEGLGPISAPRSFTTQLHAPNLLLPSNNMQINAPQGASTVRPTFSWNGIPGEIRFRLSVRSLGGNELYSQETNDASVTVPAISALNSGNYLWDVTAFRRGEAPTSQPRAVSETRAFSVRTEPQFAPQQVAPANPSIDRLSRPTFVWEKRVQANDYVIEIIQGSDTDIRRVFGGTTSDNLLGQSVLMPGSAVPGNENQLQFRIPDSIAGLPGARKFFWRMRARNEIGGSPWSVDTLPPTVNWQNGWWEFNTGLESPAAESPTPNSTVSDRTPTFTATSVSGASTYDFEIHQGSLTEPLYRSGTSNTGTRSWTVPDASQMAAGHTYWWRARASGPPDETAKSAWSPWSSFLLRTAPLNAPGNLVPEAGDGNRSVTPNFEWNRVSQSTSYQLQIRPAGGTVFHNANIPEVPNVTTQSYLLPAAATLAKGTEYEWRIAAVNEVAPGPWSDWTGFWTTMNAPVLISPLNATIQDQTPTLSWNSVTGANGYAVEVYVNGQTVPVYSTQNGGSLNATTATLNANQTYLWKVRAVRGTVTGPWSALGTFTIRTAPNNAPSLISPGVQETEVGTLTNFTWSGAPQATSYDLQVVQAPGGTVEDYSSATDSFILPEVSRLRGDRPHFWRVRGRNELGAGPWTVQSADFNLWRGFRTRLNQPVHTSPAFGAQGVSRNPTLQWQPTTGVDGYNVQLWIQDNTQPGGMRELPARYGSTTATSFMIGGNPLQAGTLYYWRVEADGPTTTKFSDFWYFITHP